ncbi:MAG: uroporphyrinogen decarboxylase family protein [Deltaproteobacteria bacterium]|nr:uroporphyrinogen decarboxylase family protein [Deltaproteobacteria bacterium]
MNGYERIMAALRLEQPDRVPIFELLINEPVISALYPDLSTDSEFQRGSQGGYRIQADFIEREDIDAITIFEDGRVEWIDEEHYIDEWGLTWQVPPSGIPYVVVHPIQSEKDLDALTPPDPDADYRLDTLKEAVKRFNGERAIIFLGHDAFEFSHYLRGMENLLMDYILNPDFAKGIAKKVMDYKKRVLQRAADEGADILLTGDDYSHRHASIMSPEHFREFVLPYLQDAVDVAKEKGVPFIKHTDGNIWAIMDDIVSTGIDAIDPLEPIAEMDIGEVKELYGSRIAVAGNVDCGELLSRSTPEEVVEAVKETIAKASPGGGHILASSNSIHPAVKPENYKAMLEAAKRYGQYPLDEKMVEEYRTKNYIEKFEDKDIGEFRAV